jgi:hypothetical protein
MMVWTIVSGWNSTYNANPVGISQTTTEVTASVCEKAKAQSGEVKTALPNQSVKVTVLCIPVK